MVDYTIDNLFRASQVENNNYFNKKINNLNIISDINRHRAQSRDNIYMVDQEDLG